MQQFLSGGDGGKNGANKSEDGPMALGEIAFIDSKITSTKLDVLQPLYNVRVEICLILLLNRYKSHFPPDLLRRRGKGSNSEEEPAHLPGILVCRRLGRLQKETGVCAEAGREGPEGDL